jgi:hypothetical protein
MPIHEHTIALGATYDAIGQDPVLTFRLGLDFKQAIDRWRSMEADKPSRSEAIRWLIGEGLMAQSKSARNESADFLRLQGLIPNPIDQNSCAH